MTLPRPTHFRGIVEGEIIEITHIDIDCPLIGTAILISKEGAVSITVDDKEILHIGAKRGAILSVLDRRTEYFYQDFGPPEE